MRGFEYITLNHAPRLRRLRKKQAATAAGSLTIAKPGMRGPGIVVVTEHLTAAHEQIYREADGKPGN